MRPHPLSFSQRQLWFLQSYDPALTAYNLPRVFELRGPLDVAALERAFEAVIERHSTLRTRFFEQDGTPVQEVVPDVAFRLGREDLTALAPAAREIATAASVASIVRHVFRLDEAPLLVAKVIRTGSDEHLLAICLHHIASDAWSNPIIARDLAEAYRTALRQHGPVHLPAISLQYVDHAVWQREQLECGALAEELEYWNAYLGPDVPPLELPVSRARPASQTFNGATCLFTLEAAQVEALRRFCRSERCTPFVVLLAAWQVLLARYCDQEDFAIGVPNAGRRRLEVQELVGFFVTTQVYRVRLTPRQTLRQLCRQIRAEALAALNRSDLPLEVLLDARRAARDPARSPLFQTLFDLRVGDDRSALTLAGLTARLLEPAAASAKFDLSLAISLSDQQGQGRLEYNTDILDERTVIPLGAAYARVLEAIVATPDQAWTQVRILDEAAEAQLDSWQSNRQRYPGEPPVHRSIELQAVRHPAAIALTCKGIGLTYAALNAGSNRLAHRLIALGVRPEVRVGIALERSFEMVSGLLAVLKSGGAYVPLDPAYPAERLSYMLRDSGIRLLLTQRHIVGQLPVLEGVTVLTLDELDLSAEPATDPEVMLHPDHPAYVIYTSGSTGAPKGAQLSHRNVSRLLAATQSSFGFGAHDVWTLFHSYAFDFSVWEIFGALCHGGRLVVVPYEVSRSPEQFLRLLREQHVTVLNQTPSAFRQLLRVPGLYACDDLSLRVVIFGGESLEPRSLRPWIERFGDAQPQLVNMYGITETTVHVTYRRIIRSDLAAPRSPVGVQLPDLRLRVLDSQLGRVPAGVAGELYVAGEGLARGYLNRAGLTAERFIADPFAVDGQRLYRTGDRVRWNEAGELEYLGRIDNQVKIRGFRIELGEIEAQLLAQPAVRAATVVTREGPNGPRLLAYVAGGPEADIDPPAIRARLSRVLPDYMVPAAVIALGKLPLNVNGKLDHKALPDPPHTGATDQEAPQGEREAALAAIWSAALGVERIGRLDNFFALGGDSILSLKVVAQARERGITVTARQLFQHQTLSALAQALADEPDDAESTLPVIPVVDRTAPLPLSYAQSRQWFLWQLDERSTAYHVRAALRLQGELSVGALQAAFTTLLERHEALRTVFRASSEGIAEQVIQPPQVLEIPVIDLEVPFEEVRSGALQAAEPRVAELREARLAEAAARIAATPFDLTAGPLLRAALIRLSAAEHVLVVVMHHIVCDGWSMQILLDEWVESYRAVLSGRQPDLEPLPIQYADYALWQKTWLQTDRQERQLQYWRAVLGDEHPVLQLSTDRPRSAEPKYRAARLGVELPAPLIERLYTQSRECQATLFMVLLAGFQALLYRHTGQHDIRVGTPNANRTRPETQGVVGFFVNTQVLRCRVEGRMSLRALLEQVRAAVSGAQEYQDLPFEALVDALQPERSSSHPPLFQVMMNHQRRDTRGLRQLPGLAVQGYELAGQAAQFELVLDTVEDAQGGLGVALIYAGELFARETIERLGQHYVRVLQALADQPQTRIDALALLSGQELRQLQRWSVSGYQNQREPAHAEPVHFEPVHGLIERRAQQNPAATALLFRESRLSYGELNRRANRLARRLIALGVGPEHRVGLALERSPEMIVGMLAVLKAGAAYVPLDPGYPRERLRYMMDDSGMALLLTQQRLIDRLPEVAGLTLLPLDMPEAPELSELSEAPDTLDASEPPESLDPGAKLDTDPAIPVHAHTPAYVIYTSGTTGRPKGVTVSHGPLSMHLQALSSVYGVREEDRELLFNSISFDAAVEQWLGPLLAGAAIVLPEGEDRSYEEVERLIRTHSVSILHMPPVYLRHFVRELAGRALPIPLCIAGGEAWSRSDFEAAQRAFRPERLVNAYGPTETVITPTAWRAQATTRLWQDSVPIGRPVGDRTAYILDADLNPTPLHVAGEIYLGGSGLARGYLNAPGLSAGRFVADPFSGHGGRLYRTGDRARWNAAGELEYLGRIDQQVKIRGFRIELAEIESQLLAQPEVREAVVVAKEGQGGARLVAYVVPAVSVPADTVLADAAAEVVSTTIVLPRAQLDTMLVRQRLATLLPDYMLPAAIVVLDALPLTTNGKVDRKALPDPSFAPLPVSGGPDEAPRSECEQALAAIWSTVLGLERIGRNDNFFALGGDSILSLQIVARARGAGWRITPRQLFERQTLAQLAEVAAALGRPDALDHSPALHAGHVVPHGAVPLLPIQVWFFEQDIPARHHWNQSVLLHSREPLDAERLTHALETLVDRHDALRLRYTQDAAGCWHQAYAELGAECEQLWQREAASANEIAAICAEAQRSLDLSAGPLLRAVSIRVADGSFRLLLVIHHLIVDGVSWRIVLEDLQSAYHAARADHTGRATSYQHWARRLQQHARDHVGELPYWQRLAAVPVVPFCDNPLGDNRVRDQSSIPLRLDRPQTEALLREVPVAYRTQINDVLLTALARALHRWRGSEQVLVDLEGHGREDLFEDLDLSRTMGWFTSVYPVVLEPAGELPAALQRIKETLREVPCKGLGYGVLRYLGTPEQQRTLAALPPAPVAFNYLGQFDGSFESHASWRPAAEAAGPSLDPLSARQHELAVDGRIYDGELRLNVSYSTQRHRYESVQTFVDLFRQELEALIAHCTSGVRGVTPSDFPLASLSQEELNALPMPAGRIEDLYPLTALQQGLLFQSLQTPEEGAYVIQLRVDIEGLDVAHFRAAWQAVVERHDVLRTGFLHERDTMLQWVSTQAQIAFDESDWRGRADLAPALDECAVAQRRQPFDLGQPPLMRIALVRTAESTHHFIWTSHHLLTDGWSTAQLIGEVLHHYSQRNLPPLQGRYRDYVSWLQQRDPRAAQTYWQGRLQPLQEPTHLVAALPAKSASEWDGEHVHSLDPGATQRLVEFARQERVTLNTLVQGAWALLLSRYTGHRCVTFGTTTAGRPAEIPGIEHLIGLFINTLPVIAVCRPEASVGDWLRELQAQGVASREHEHTALYDIQRWAGGPRGGLFDTLLVFENYPVDETLREGSSRTLRFSHVSHQDRTHYPLSIAVSQAQTLRFRYTGRRDLLSAETVSAIAASLHRLLTEMAVSAQRHLGELDLIPLHERARLEEWGMGGRRYPAAVPVHRLIERQVEQRPEATALVHGATALSYGELNRRANQLAHRLRALGVGPEVRVGIALERSIELVVALLGVLKAGGAYVPLDPAYPLERLSYTIRDSAIGLLLTHAPVADRLPLVAGVATLGLDQLDLSPESQDDPRVTVHPDSLAYVIYTSGSTGKPKGAQLCHRNVTRLLEGTREWFHFDDRDVWTLFHSFAFDFSVWELFGALCYGGRAVLVPYEVSRSPEEFLGLLRRQRVTVLNQTPSAFKQLLQVPGLSGQAGLDLRLVIFGGEALDPRSLRPWIERYGDQQPRLVNMYGITETTVHVTYRPITAADLDTRLSPIGRPIPDLGLRVLDPSLNPVPIGVTGELYVAGDGLARGYLGRAALTGERFVADPLSGGGRRLYRTGDLARWHPDGELEYRGRADEQVKIRGFRVELGEIEAQLLAQPGIREALVVLREDAQGARLVAYVTGNDVEEIQSGRVRDRLSQVLPAHMVPAALVVMEKLPLNANGKVDRGALPEPQYTSAVVYEAPHGELEQTLADLWSGLLGIERVGRNDNFFELGGDSILTLKLIARARQRSIVLTPRLVLQHPSLGALAQELSANARSGGVANTALIPVVDRNGPLPLSAAQTRLWFLWQLDESSTAYHSGTALRMTGALDTEALDRAFADLTDRHESLRTVFLASSDGVAGQVIRPKGESRIELLDLSRVPANMREGRAAEEARRIARNPFDLTVGPLFRAGLIRLSGAEHVLVMVMHHIVSDGWSMQILMEDLLDLYQARVAGRAPALDTLPIQYADYAAWQRVWLDAGARQQQEAYWRERLGAEHPVLQLPTDHPRVAEPKYRATLYAFGLPAALASGLQQRARERRTTLFTVLLAGFQALLYRYTGQQDIRVGIANANRDRPETQGVVGFFVNTQVLRSQIAGRMPLDALLEQVREAVAGAQEHQHLPFEQLVEALQPARSLSHSPLFQVMMNHQRREARGPDQLPGLVLQRYELGEQQALFDLTLRTTERADGTVAATLVYAAELFDADTIARLAGYYLQMLAAIAEHPQCPVGEVSLRSEALGHEPSPAQWPAARMPAAPLSNRVFDPVHHRITRRAAQCGVQPAVHCDGRTLSYAELERWSDRIALGLRALNVRAETRVGLCVERSVGMVAALLGILKSGGAFVPLDPAFPAERLSYMIEDAGLQAVVLDRESAARCAAPLVACPQVRIDLLDDTLDAQLPEITIAPLQLAYVIYTSGSTGQPKGVAITHRALSLHLDDFIACYGITAADKMLQSSTINFDVALHELLPALIMGGQVQMRGPQPWDLDGLSRTLREEQVSFARIPTALWQQWLQALPRELPRLRQITVGGEALPGDALGRWLEGPLHAIALDNLYGPTETTVACLAHRCRPVDAQQHTVSIGRPYPSRAIQLLDAAGNAVPVGGMGELCISGETLARGYLDRPGLTAERFVPDPAGGGGRLYRSGDLCRQRADGSVDYLGRLDQQVKLRGHRIELGEVEAALRRCTGVSEAVVELRGEGERRRLVGYIVGRGEPAAVKAELQERLPAYLVPGAIVTLERLPLSPTGKVDRRALPEPRQADTRGYEAPQGPIEAALATIWAGLLGLERVGRRDNFFERGGDSILSLKVIAQARQHSIVLTPKQLFQHQRLDVLAEVLAKEPSSAVAEDAIVPLGAAAGAGGSPALSHAQARQWFLWRLDERSTAYHISSALRLQGSLDAAVLRSCLASLVSRHAALRTIFPAGGDGVPRQMIQTRGGLEITSCDLGEWDAESRETRVAQEVARLRETPFNLTRGPLLRVALLRLSPEDHVLAVVLHHIVSDGWSMQIFVAELVELYRARLEGREPDLAPLPIQYADYAAWQRRWLEAGEQERQLRYWRERLGDEHPLLLLPTDHPRAMEPKYRAAHHPFEVPETLVRGLQARAREHRATLFMVLLAGFQALLHRYTGEPDVRVGVTNANRSRPETQGVMGFFVNTQVLRTVIDGRMTLRALLEQACAAVAGAQEHQDLPFEQLVEALQPQRSLAHPPLFQVMMSHQRRDYRSLEQLPGLALRGYEAGGQAAQFELTLNTTEHPDGRVTAAWVYAAELFEPGTMERFGRYYLRVLQAVAGQPEAAVSAVPLLDEADRARLLRQGTNARRHPHAEPVHRLIERQARQRPGVVALILDDTEVTYGELNTRANRLAHRLIAVGVGPETKTGVALERSIEMIVALLGILKAGGAYVPLDPGYPPERLRYMMQDSGIGLVLIRGPSPAPGITTMEIESPNSPEATQPTDSDPGVPVHPDNLAYLIYTSGSTGRPKGIGISHRALVEHSQVAVGYFNLTPADRMLQFSTINFDAFVEQLFPPLCVGAAVVLRGPALWDSETFRREVLDKRITIADLPTAYWFMLTQDFRRQPRHDYGVLRQVQATGEALPPEGIRGWREAGLAHVRLLNTYGPTEATVTATAFDCHPYTGESAQLPTQVPIGTPLAGRHLYVLDAQLDLAAPGVVGELYVGGPLLARGYHDRPALTSERFIADPFCDSGERLYRTGDLARWNADGQLEYLGRVDYQVKLRGFRIELGEIEAHLLALPEVREAVVVAQESPGGARLVAYVVGARAGIDVTALRESLARALPEYMVPNAIVPLQEMPLNANGKLDRKALPVPRSEPEDGSYTAPAGEIEVAVAGIWTEVLGVARIGRRDDFFVLGGHSLALLRVQALIQTRLSVQLPLRAYFENASLEAVAYAVLLERERGGEAQRLALDEMSQLLETLEA